MDKIFKPNEVDVLIPKVENIFQHMDACQRRTHELATTRPAIGDKSTAGEVADSARIRSQMEFLLAAVQEDIALIADLGGAVKDMSAGLVDFPGIVDGADVWLCWKRGETKVDFWHPLDAGFSERRVLRRSGTSSTVTH